MSEVLALKYRPTSFDEVIGQEDLVRQLRASLKTNTLGHALLFCGPRGTGKTTTARIIARELNPNLTDAELVMNVTEIDAASNTGVDNVRELIENIRYSTRGHKVIILDEAHMMTKNAFNALLKTLEEPPPGVTFILVTTEPHKLIPTVVSRCQKYEFTEVDQETLEDYYNVIVVGEDLEKVVSRDRVHDISLKAEGSVRDGLSLLQKALSGEVVADNSKTYFELVGAIYSQDVATALSIVSDLRRSEEARVIIQTLEKWFYWCSLESFGMKTPVREYFGNGADLNFDLNHLQKLFDSCLDIERSFTATPNAKIVLEMGIIKLCV
jgi:DNA polymerase-3 subunit gamma/tau